MDARENLWEINSKHIISVPESKKIQQEEKINYDKMR